MAAQLVRPAGIHIKHMKNINGRCAVPPLRNFCLYVQALSTLTEWCVRQYLHSQHDAKNHFLAWYAHIAQVCQTIIDQ